MPPPRLSFVPIEAYVAELRALDFPVEAVALCTARYPESGPLLRRLIERAGDGALAGEDEERQLVRALYIAGGRRDPLIFEPLLRLLRRPRAELEEMLGDALVEGLPRIVAGAFDGNAHALFEAIVDLRIDEYVRDALMGAAAFLTFDKRIGLEQMVGFLGRFGTERLAPDGEFVWFGWAEAIAFLGLRILEPLVMAAFDRGAIPEEILDREAFAEDLAAAERNPHDAERFANSRLTYIDDVLVAAGDIRFDADPWGDDEKDDDAWEDDDLSDDADVSEAPRIPTSFLPTRPGPATNPLRHVGRNDPCPCGSGKKAKRCCLRT